MKSLEDLDDMTLKSVMNHLFRFTTDSVEEKFHIDLPKQVSIEYKCGNCKSSRHVKIAVKSVKGMKKYVPCTQCKYRSDMFARKLVVERENATRSIFGSR